MNSHIFIFRGQTIQFGQTSNALIFTFSTASMPVSDELIEQICISSIRNILSCVWCTVSWLYCVTTDHYNIFNSSELPRLACLITGEDLCSQRTAQYNGDIEANTRTCTLIDKPVFVIVSSVSWLVSYSNDTRALKSHICWKNITFW